MWAYMSLSIYSVKSGLKHVLSFKRFFVSHQGPARRFTSRDTKESIMASASQLSPTFFGHIASTQDALLLFEACLSGALNHVPRRPGKVERVSLIKSGNVFLYNEPVSGIKRWNVMFRGVPAGFWETSSSIVNWNDHFHREKKRGQ